MGIVLYNTPMDARLNDKKFYQFFCTIFEEEHKNDPPVMDDDTWTLAIRNEKYVDRIFELYKKQR